jgi:lipopolysaccharide biosynthesis regulator YciM
MKKYFFILLLLITSLLSTNAISASTPPTLSKIDKSYSNSSLQLSCSFNSLPKYSFQQKGKRIDFTFTSTLSADDLVLPETDDKIVKFLTLPQKNDTVISLFFRYPPQKVKIIPASQGNELRIDIILGNEFTASQSNVVSRPQDLPNPVKTCPYVGNWKNFFKEYEAEVKLESAIQYSLLPFPAIALLQSESEEKDSPLLGPEIMEGAKHNSWNDLIPVIFEQLSHETNPANKKKLSLTYGEILLRAGKIKEAHKQFFLLSEEHADESIGVLAKYLLIRLQAEHADLFLADVELKDLEAATDPGNSIRPYVYITQIEIALATKQWERMRILLEKDDIPSPARISTFKALRQADYWLATDDFIKAQAGYQLLDKAGTLAEDIFSLNGYCSTLYHHQQFKEALTCYDRLAKHPKIDAQKYLGMISFRMAMAKRRFTPESKMLNDFAAIELAYPDTEAGIRAAIKQTDIKMLTTKNWEKTGMAHYQTLAETAEALSIREEAAFKVILANYLLGQKDKGMELLMNFLKEFKNGALHETALALLIETMPEILKEQIKNGKYVEALVLAQQNKNLFAKKWIDIKLLADMAGAYQELGFFNEASRMYLYLLDVGAGEDNGPYYLPLIKLAYEQGEFEMVEEYADQYQTAYPKGPAHEEILLVRLQNLMTHNKNQEALTLLSEHKSTQPRFKEIQATLYFQLNDYAKAKAILEELKITVDSKGKDKLFDPVFMLAESAYQTGDIKKSAELFTTVQQESSHQDQSLFRLGQIARQNGDSESALKYFKQIVEKGSNPLWQKLAKKELELTALSK